MAESAARPITVFVACSGLGRVRRGFETFARESFDALSGLPGVRARLFKAAGEADAPGETVVRSPARDGRVARALAHGVPRAPDIPGIKPYIVEAVAFALGLARHVARERPDVVLFSDPHIGTVLARLRPRRLVPQSTRLLFSNGGPLPPPYPWFDHVHHTTVVTHRAALEAGEPADRQTLLPYGFAFDQRPLPPVDGRAGLRGQLNLPTGPLVLSVGALNTFHKRTDYLVREVAALPEPRPHLVLLGDRRQGQGTEAEAAALLGSDGFTARTVAPEEVTAYYDAADVFALGSLDEGFGRVYVEALARGLPCVAHDSEHTRSLFGGDGRLTDLRRTGAGAEALEAALAEQPGDQEREARARAVTDRFSWDALVPDYLAMAQRCARSTARAG